MAGGQERSHPSPGYRRGPELQPREYRASRTSIEASGISAWTSTSPHFSLSPHGGGEPPGGSGRCHQRSADRSLECKHVSPAPRDTLVQGHAMTEPAVPWPNARSSRDGIIAQFGASRADLVGCALVTGDPLADAVVEEIHSGQPGVNAALNAGVRHGLEPLIDAPLAVAALLASAETLPASVDDELVDHGTAPFFSA